MIVTANKYVNARIGKPFTDAPNPSFLQPGDQIEVVKRIYGEYIEGNNEWYIGKDGNLYTSKGFINNEDSNFISLLNNSSLFEEYEISEAWKKTQGDDIKVAIVDCGFDLEFEALRNTKKMVNGPINSSCYHGNYMATIIGGTDYLKGYIGLAPQAEYIYYSLGDINKLSPDILMNCLNNLNGVDIISMSFSSFKPEFGLKSGGKAISAKIKDMIAKYQTVFIASAGNDSAIDRDYYPAAYQDVISVSGYGKKKSEVVLSANIWQGVSVIVPFTGFFDKTPEDFQKYFLFPSNESADGTSSGTAFTAGIMALLKSWYWKEKKVKLNSQEIKEKVFSEIVVNRERKEGVYYKTNFIDKNKFINEFKI